MWCLRMWWWGKLLCLLACNLRPEGDSRWASGLRGLDVWCCWGRASVCWRGGLRSRGGGLLVEGAYPCLESVEALVLAATRELDVFDCRVELVCLRKVVGLDFCKESGDRGDEGVHAGLLLGSSCRCKPLEQVGLWVFLTGKIREIGSVAAWTFGCGGVGCGEEAAGSCPCERGSSGTKQRGVGARNSTTTGGLGPPVRERGSGEALPNA